ncbi:cytochrome P450 [Phaeosphaeriaceae sp. PMI808]|nr:cytochrome P450 [Phaeosphaeriaceae sp. PMI808]
MAFPVLCLIILNIFKSLRRLKESKPPVAPHSIPLLGHAHLFLTQPAKLASILSKSEQLIRLKVPFSEIWFAKGSNHIWQILSDPTTFDFEPMKIMVLKRLLGLSGKVVDLCNSDDSGVGEKPYPGTTVPPERRLNYMERQATKDFTRPASHAAFLETYESNLYQWVEKCDIGSEWVNYLDLYQFLRKILFRATTNAFYGSHLLQTTCNLEEDLWKFEENVPFHANGLPSILNRQAFKVRTRCIEAFRKWRAFALNVKSEQLPEWNEVSGLKTNTLRKETFDRFQGWDDTSCAASDLAVLFGLTSNSIRAAFWFFFETLRCPGLRDNAAKEISSIIITPHSDDPTPELPPRFDTKRLVRLPLLQSLFAETLRTYVSVMIVRTTRKACRVGGWAIGKDQQAMVCNYAQHMDEKLWGAGSPSSPALNEFWGRRFLSTSETTDSSPSSNDQSLSAQSGQPQPREATLRFTGEGLGIKFFPLGMGQRMCPGRHFAKLQALLTYALITKTFEIELMVDDG